MYVYTDNLHKKLAIIFSTIHNDTVLFENKLNVFLQNIPKWCYTLLYFCYIYRTTKVLGIFITKNLKVTLFVSKSNWCGMLKNIRLNQAYVA